MYLIRPYYETLTKINTKEIYKRIEKIGRICYKSESKITDESAKKFVKMIVKSGHHSVIEHINISVKFVINRGISHELVRHRLASYSQESTRYCNYSKKGLVFIIPLNISFAEGNYRREWWCQNDYDYYYNDILINETKHKYEDFIWLNSMLAAEENYNQLLKRGWQPQQARDVLPHALKTEIISTMNLRMWIHVLNQRVQKNIHPQFREITIPLLKELQDKLPLIFNDIK